MNAINPDYLSPISSSDQLEADKLLEYYEEDGAYLKLDDKGELTAKKADYAFFAKSVGSSKSPQMEKKIFEGLRTLAKQADLEIPDEKQKLVNIVSKLSAQGLIESKKEGLDIIQAAQEAKLVTTLYQKHYNVLISHGKTSFEAMAETVDLALKDPRISDSYKDQIKPQLIQDGSSGVYFVKDLYGNKIAVFKPEDEEPGMPNCPTDAKGIHRASLEDVQRTGFPTGGAYKRERSSCIVAQKLFPSTSMIPDTVITSLTMQKVHGQDDTPVLKKGSLQKFSSAKPFAEAKDLTQAISETDSVEVQRTTLLQMVLGNNDCNFGNTLQGGNSLVSIDHGLSMGEDLVFSESNPKPKSGFEFHLLYHYKLDEPVDQSLVDSINAFDLEGVKSQLKQEGVSSTVIQAMELRYKVVKYMLNEGFNVRQIARFLNSRKASGDKTPIFNDLYQSFIERHKAKRGEKLKKLTSKAIDSFLFTVDREIQQFGREKYLRDLPPMVYQIYDEAKRPEKGH